MIEKQPSFRIAFRSAKGRAYAERKPTINSRPILTESTLLPSPGAQPKLMKSSIFKAKGNCMACRGVHFALTDAQRAELIDLAKATGDVMEFVQEEIEEQWDRDWLCETDKAWDAIHRCLTDGSLSFDRDTPLHWCVLGGSQLYKGDDYVVSFVDTHDVHTVADAVDAITMGQFRKKYDAIDPRDYGVPLSEEDFEYTWSSFVDLRDFFRKAARADRAVVFTVDQ